MTESATSASATRPPLGLGRRSVTVPTRLGVQEGGNGSSDTTTDATGAETLFVHPAAKVVSFSAGKLGHAGKSPRVEAGTLPYKSRGELVISLGMLIFSALW